MTGPDVPLDEWHQYVFTWNNDTHDATIYVDGALWGSQNEAGVTWDPSVVMTGTAVGAEFYLESSRAFNGDFNTFRLYDMALTDGEVLSNFQAGPSMIPEPVTMSLLVLGGLLALRRRRAA